MSYYNPPKITIISVRKFGANLKIGGLNQDVYILVQPTLKKGYGGSARKERALECARWAKLGFCQIFNEFQI